MAPEHDNWLPTRRTLLSRLKDWDDQVSWQDFFDTYSRLIYSTAARAGLNDSESQDVVQEVIIAVARQMPAFRYDPAIGSFKNWLLRITQRRIADQLRRKYREGALESAPERSTVQEPAAPESTEESNRWDEAWEENLMRAALAKVRARVDPKQFQVFDCYVLKSWPVKDVVQTLDVTPNQVYLARSRVGTLVRKELDRLRREMV